MLTSPSNCISWFARYSRTSVSTLTRASFSFVVFSAFVPWAACHSFGTVKEELISWIGYSTLEFSCETYEIRHCFNAGRIYMYLRTALAIPSWEEDNGAYLQPDKREILRQRFFAPLDSMDDTVLPMSIGLINQLIHLQPRQSRTARGSFGYSLWMSCPW